MTRRPRPRQQTSAAASITNDLADYQATTLPMDHSQELTPLHDGNDQDSQAAMLLSSSSPDSFQAKQAMHNFVLMGTLFSANHGCVVACLGLATSRFGVSLGAAQSGMLYLAYTLSGLFGSTYVVKRLGARDALIAGMGMYMLYVGCFWLATIMVNVDDSAARDAAVYLGGVIGGIGAGFLWTAQGSYFTSTAQTYARHSGMTSIDASAKLASIFAFLYLGLEVLLRGLSTVLVLVGLDWSTVFQIYAFITALSTILMLTVQKVGVDESSSGSSVDGTASAWYKITAAWQLLKNDSRMKYMIGLNAVFGLSASFLNSYVNGQVVRIVLQDGQSKYVGMLTSGMAAWAAVMSLVFGKAAATLGKGTILIIGSVCFSLVALPFILYPSLESWNWPLLVFVYMMQGTGRSTFEGTLKAVFADLFSYEKEGAFANIILQNGLSTSIGFAMTIVLSCQAETVYCVRYKDGSLHDVLSFELAIVAAAVAAIAGYLRAFSLHQRMLEVSDDAVGQITEACLPTNDNEGSTRQ